MRANDRAGQIKPKRPTPDVCEHGNADSQALVRQLAEALGHDLPALPETPEQVWNRLLDEVEALRG